MSILGSPETARPFADRIQQLYPRLDVQLIFHVYRKNDCCIALRWNELDRQPILDRLIKTLHRIPNPGYYIDFKDFVRWVEENDPDRRPKEMVLILRPLTDKEMRQAICENGG